MYEVKCISKTVNFIRKIVKKTYKITKVITDCGVVLPSNQIPRAVRPHEITRGGDLGKASSSSARARSDANANNAARQAARARKTSPTLKSGKIGVAEAFSPNSPSLSRPAAADRLGNHLQYQTGLAKNGNGIFGRFSARPLPDPSNPGCAGGPRSITHLSKARSSEEISGRQIATHDGLTVTMTDSLTTHLTSRHGHSVGINDPLPVNPNQKPTKFPQVRTRTNTENKQKFGDVVKNTLQDQKTQVFPDVDIRGIKSHWYFSQEAVGEGAGFFVGVHMEGPSKGQIKKAQPVSEQ